MARLNTTPRNDNRPGTPRYSLDSVLDELSKPARFVL